ncbi:MAG: tetratricopeptide repeat protein [Candidatus Binatia bacterium]
MGRNRNRRNRSGNRTWVAAVLAMVMWGTPAAGECLPAGRPTFTAGLHALGQGDLSAAQRAFDTLVQQQPTCAEARNNLAVVLVERGQLAAAAVQLRQALAARPDYARARLNLQRVESLLAARTASVSTPAAPLEIEAAPSVQPIATPTQPAATPQVLPAAPASLVALEPVGAVACVLEPEQHRLCIYRRAASGIVPDACYSVVVPQARHWRPWLATGELTARRIGLVDETGQLQLQVVPVGAAAAGPTALQLKPADLAAVAARVVRWRTAWVLRSAAPATGANAAAAAVRAALAHWRRAWAHTQFDAYVRDYSATFTPQQDPDRAHWLARKRYLFAHSGAIHVQLTAVSIFLVDGGQTALTTFEQSYRSDIFASRAFKVLRWQRENGRWTISVETVLREAAQRPAGDAAPPASG